MVFFEFFYLFNKDNGFTEILYEIEWDVLPPNIQRIIMLLIHRKQNEPGLKLGPFGTGINREIFKLVRYSHNFILSSTYSTRSNVIKNDKNAEFFFERRIRLKFCS